MVNIFQYPIFPGSTRDLLKIPGINESDIRGSLLKGEIRHKILAKEIVIVCSDIDLLQFNDEQRAFLKMAGIDYGTTITTDQAPGFGGIKNIAGTSTITTATTPYVLKQGMDLTGIKNGSNKIFHTIDKFINGVISNNTLTIEIFHNGRRMAEHIEYKLSESGAVGSGYNTITFVSFSPISSSILKSNYCVKST